MRLGAIINAVLVWGAVSPDGLEKLRQEKSMFVVPENRPYMLGLKRNCPLFKKENLRFVYCTDNVLGLLFYKKKIKKTAVFYKEKTENSVIGIPGTLYAVMLSRLHDVPVEFLPADPSAASFYEGDSAQLGGRVFVSADDRQKCVVTAADEIISEQEIK